MAPEKQEKRGEEEAQARLPDLNFVRDKLQKFQSKMLRDFDQRLSCMVEDVLQDLRQRELRAHEFPNFERTDRKSTWHNRVNSEAATDVSDSPNGHANGTNPRPTAQHQSEKSSQKQRRQLPEKVFVARESYLTALLQVEHMRTIYHIFYIILVMFLLNVICYDYFVEGRIDLGLGTFRGGLRRLHWVMGVWFLEHIFVLALYFAFRGWALVRHKLKPHSE
uniref:Uncharacterized protein LOC108045600 n=1 Tax=Drosophila rhopaloa TaxID=1041015 RepID=A0A6P4F551_DRORH